VSGLAVTLLLVVLPPPPPPMVLFFCGLSAGDSAGEKPSSSRSELLLFLEIRVFERTDVWFHFTAMFFVYACRRGQGRFKEARGR